MADVADLLVEIGTEELPPRSLESLAEAFAREMSAALDGAGLEHGEIIRYATPRRLALLVPELQTSQPERQSERRGPALSAAFDDDGNPTKAALGFARSCGVDTRFLDRLETEKGGWLVFRTTEVAQPTEGLIGPMVSDVLTRLPIPRRMRWGTLDAEFVRPVHWVVLLLGETVIEAEILGVSSGSETRGHRFHHPEVIPITAPAEYEKVLYGSGFVVVDFAARREMIETQVTDAAAAVQGRPLMDPDLLDEVTALVEWPVALVGSFEEEFLELPRAVLVATMKGHQKYFPVVDDDGTLLPHFVTVSNIQSTNPDAVREGNERVIRPRLSDAAFFYRTDLEQPLDARRESLDDIVFHRQLGSLGDKTDRVSALAGHVAIAMGQSPEEVKLARRAGQLCKCDLLSEMVAEFPELQGFMGREYAAHGGEPEAVAVALEEVYRPRYAGDAIAETPTGRALAIADKLDTLVGIFGVGQVPSGDKDPFALRRAALGALRTMIEGELDVDLTKLLAAAVNEYGDRLTAENIAAEVFEFTLDRLRAYFLDQDIPPGVFSAVQARQPRRPYDLARRVWAVNEFRKMPEAESLSAANKRIQNILKQVDDAVPDTVEEGLLTEDAEWNLAAKLVGLTPLVREMLKGGDYTAALKHLASLRDSVDEFFDSVKVMADDDSVRNNRLALLNNLGTLFMQTADISRLQE